MITKHYSVMCDSCTKSEPLFGENLSECKEEMKNMGWSLSKGNCFCDECKKTCSHQGGKNGN